MFLPRSILCHASNILLVTPVKVAFSNFPASFFITNYQAFNTVKAAGHFWTFCKVQANSAEFKPDPLCDGLERRQQPQPWGSEWFCKSWGAWRLGIEFCESESTTHQLLLTIPAPLQLTLLTGMSGINGATQAFENMEYITCSIGI